MGYITDVILSLLFLAILAFGGRLYMLGKFSKNTEPQNIGINNGHLQACGNKPNCVSSQAQTGTDFYIEAFSGLPQDKLWQKLKTVLNAMDFKIEKEDSNYIHATATSKLFHFVDDLEFLNSDDSDSIEVRSASRVGYSDLGANRKRIEAIRSALKK